MITILPADEATVARLAAEEQTTLLDQGVILCDNGTELGHMLYAIRDNVLYIGDAVCEDYSLKDGLLRSVVNIGWNHEIEPVIYAGDAERDFLKRYGFAEKDGRLCTTVAEFFQPGCKSCKNKE